MQPESEHISLPGEHIWAKSEHIRQYPGHAAGDYTVYLPTPSSAPTEQLSWVLNTPSPIPALAVRNHAVYTWLTVSSSLTPRPLCLPYQPVSRRPKLSACAPARRRLAPRPRLGSQQSSKLAPKIRQKLSLASPTP